MRVHNNKHRKKYQTKAVQNIHLESNKKGTWCSLDIVQARYYSTVIREPRCTLQLYHSAYYNIRLDVIQLPFQPDLTNTMLFNLQTSKGLYYIYTPSYTSCSGTLIC